MSAGRRLSTPDRRKRATFWQCGRSATYTLSALPAALSLFRRFLRPIGRGRRSEPSHGHGRPSGRRAAAALLSTVRSTSRRDLLLLRRRRDARMAPSGQRFSHRRRRSRAPFACNSQALEALALRRRATACADRGPEALLSVAALAARHGGVPRDAAWVAEPLRSPHRAPRTPHRPLAQARAGDGRRAVRAGGSRRSTERPTSPSHRCQLPSALAAARRVRRTYLCFRCRLCRSRAHEQARYTRSSSSETGSSSAAARLCAGWREGGAAFASGGFQTPRRLRPRSHQRRSSVRGVLVAPVRRSTGICAATSRPRAAA